MEHILASETLSNDARAKQGRVNSARGEVKLAGTQRCERWRKFIELPTDGK